MLQTNYPSSFQFAGSGPSNSNFRVATVAKTVWYSIILKLLTFLANVATTLILELDGPVVRTFRERRLDDSVRLIETKLSRKYELIQSNAIER